MHMGGLSSCDLSLICNSLHPALGEEVVKRMVAFNCQLEREVVGREVGAKRDHPGSSTLETCSDGAKLWSQTAQSHLEDMPGFSTWLRCEGKRTRRE